jgi:hypothetical protein
MRLVKGLTCDLGGVYFILESAMSLVKRLTCDLDGVYFILDLGGVYFIKQALCNWSKG